MSKARKKIKTIVLLSGGIDSALCLSMLKTKKHEVEAVFFDYGQLALKEEKKAAKLLAQHYKVRLRTLSIRLAKQKKTGEVFGRNLFLIATAAMSYGGSDQGVTLACGIHAGTSYPDCSEYFVDQVSLLLRFLSQDRVQFLAPLKSWSKKEIYRSAKHHRVPLKLTYSCEKGGSRTCGKCQSCLDRSAL